VCPTVLFLQAKANLSPQSTYSYVFDHVVSWAPPYFGAYHASEIGKCDYFFFHRELSKHLLLNFSLAFAFDTVSSILRQ
jgi:carboxylesterase type B